MRTVIRTPLQYYLRAKASSALSFPFPTIYQTLGHAEEVFYIHTGHAKLEFKACVGDIRILQRICIIAELQPALTLLQTQRLSEMRQTSRRS